MKISIASILMISSLVACAPTPVIVTAIPMVTPVSTMKSTAEPTLIFPPTENIPSPTPTALPFYGHLEFPFLNADAGNFQLQTGQRITFIWIEAPPDAYYYEFVLYPLDRSAPIPLGTDSEFSDGVSLEWIVLPNVAAELRASAHYGPGKPVLKTFVPTLYSPLSSQ